MENVTQHEPLVPARLLGDLMQVETQNGWTVGAILRAIEGMAAEQRRQGALLDALAAKDDAR